MPRGGAELGLLLNMVLVCWHNSDSSFALHIALYLPDIDHRGKDGLYMARAAFAHFQA